MRRAVEGRLTDFRDLILASCLIALTFVTVAVTFLGVATALAVRVLVLRVLVLRALGAVADLEAVDLTGIGIDSDVYSINIHEKTPLWGFGVAVCGLVYLSLKPPRPRHAVNGLCNWSSC